MKNRSTLFASMCLLMLVALGCSFGNPFGSGETGSGEASETSEPADPGSKTDGEAAPSGEIVEVGIAECDELATYINDNAEAIGEESIVVRGIVELYKQTIFSNLRDSVKNMSDEEKRKMGENCAKALENLKKQMQK